MPVRPDETLVERFRRSLAELIPLDEGRIGIAVSGGPDSVALLLLAAATLPNRVEAATVDHRFRGSSAGEALGVAALCSRIDVPHATLTLDWTPPVANRQARAREARYVALGRWAAERGLAAVATAHHLDDQAETLLMRLDRGAGIAGLSGVRSEIVLATGGNSALKLIRPLLGWRRAELTAVPAELGVSTIADPSNTDPAHDRSRARAWLERSPDWPSRTRMASSARYLGEADAALDWAAADLLARRLSGPAEAPLLDPEGIPSELKRRLLLLMVGGFNASSGPPRSDRVTRALRLLDAGRVATIGGVVIRPRAGRWSFAPAPPRGRK
ncbi:tRNA lysidine(34) synthetase TilS [Sphingomonas sp. KRR8]|uniref:tRNA lysidine(34) synthetase TilS n=1 Tax=Sphingomonas sp. KRR8 TaxID=2942996 RepID=UPI0020208029|nr:tRNA lysidine(34) synthetase TilS [Sphingomonas sp. KRR8]URD59835.1 tRNA lysidine(34) synthetase TilS [Sphingomonas sp. KRR8]